MSLSGLSVKRPVAFFMLFIGLVGIGIVAFMGLQIALFPDMDLPMVAVRTQYSGTSPEDIESLITRPIEEGIATVENLETLSSQSKEGQSWVMAEFSWGTDMDVAERHVREKVDLVEGNLPDEAEAPLIFRYDPTSMPVMGLSVSGEKSLTELRRIAEDEVEPRLERIEGVASASAMGGEVREIQIQVGRERLTSRGITLGQLMDTIEEENVVVPAGTIEEKGTKYNIRTLGEYTSIDQIANTVVAYQNGSPVYIKDIAEVVDGAEEQERIIRVNGDRAVMITVSRASGANTVEVSNRIFSELEGIESSLPGINLSVVFEEAGIIEESMYNLYYTIILAVVLCGVVLFIFLGSLRGSLVLLISIPVSIITTFIAISLFGITMNIMSMGGLALGIGLFVDNSIVVLESIFRHREKGEPADQGAVIGSSEVATAITASTLTTISVFFPVLFVPGMAGQIFRDMVLTVTFSLLVSLFVALSLVPLISSRMRYLEQSQNKGLAHSLGQFIEKITRVYGKMLEWCLTYRWRTLATAGGLFLVSMLVLFRFVGLSFMPEMDAGSVNVSIERKVGTSLEKTDETFRKAEKIIKEKVPELKSMFTNVGSGGGPAATGGGSHAGSIRLELVDVDKRKRSTREVEAQLRTALSESLPEAEVTFTSGTAMGGMGSTTETNIQIFGHDLTQLRELSHQVKEEIRNVPGAMDVETSMGEEGQPQLNISYKRDRLYDFGLSTYYVSNLVKTAIQGSVASQYKEKGEEYDILVRMKEKDRSKLEDIGKINVLTTSKGADIRLADVVNIDYTKAPLSIDREDQQRMAEVSFRAVGRPLGDVLEDVKAKVSSISFPSDFRWEIGGSGEDMQESLTWLAYALIVGMFLVYMVMASEFESLRDPFIIFLTIPLSLIGVAWMLFLTGTTLDITSMIGIVMLVGIVINNSIVLVDYINLLHQRGKSIHEAVREAGRIRFRPVLMTALTTILAMTPLALQLGPGAENWAPMARSVIGGLLVGTFITLLIIPVFYILFEERKEKKLKLRGR